MLKEEIADKLGEINPLILRNMKFPHEIGIKSDESIVTATDRQVEHTLLPELKKLLPESAVIGEETAPIDSEAVTDLFQSEYLWAVDPIDGTVNFAASLAIAKLSACFRASYRQENLKRIFRRKTFCTMIRNGIGG